MGDDRGRGLPPLPPPGTHKARIAGAEFQRVEWRRTAANPGGEVLALRLDCGRAYAAVYCDLPIEKAFLLPPVAAAFGLEVDELDPETLAGLRCAVELDHLVTRRGRTKAVVSKWLPRQDATPRRPARARLRR